MKIAIVGPFFYPQVDGVEKVMLNHARHLAQRGHDVHVITSHQRFPKGRFEGLSECEVYDGFTIHRIRVLLRSPSRLFYYLSNSGVILSGLGGLLRKLTPDIVHMHNVAAPAWAYIAARYTQRHGKRFFYSLHYHPDYLHLPKWRTSVLHRLNALPIRTSRRLFHLTLQDYELFASEYPSADRSRFAVLPNGINPPLYKPRIIRQNETLNLLFVGRVEDHRKGFDLLQAAYAQVRRPGWTLTVVGRISEEKRSALNNEFGSAVRVLGLVKESTLEQEYAAADLFAMPSRYEGFGMPFIEAMRYGTPVIGTTVGGVPEVVPPGTGLLVKPDNAAELSEAINKLGTSIEMRKLLGEQGQRWAERFKWNRIIDLLEDHYDSA